MAVAKRQRREKLVKMGQRRTRVRTSGETAHMVSTIYTGQVQEEEKKHIKREAKIEPLFFGLVHPHALRMYFPLLINKTEL